jgi:BclB C-terminal domain-containing protein
LPNFVGFGSNAPGVDTFGTTINLEGTVLGVDLNYAFSVPRDGAITSVVAFFSVTSAVGVAVGDYEIHAQLFRSETPDNIFDALPTTDIALSPVFPGLSITLGDIATGSVSVNIPVAAGDRLLLVFYVVPPALSVAASVLGYASAGVAIS